MRQTRTLKHSILSLVIVVLLGTISGCATTSKSTSDKRDTNREVERLLTDIERSYENEDSVSIIRNVHSDFSQRAGGAGELRSDMRDVFSSYQRIRLDFFGTRITKEGNTFHAKVNWNLQWTCQQVINQDLDNDGQNECPSRNQVVRRTGRTTFSFQMDDGEWKLIEQRDNLLLGDRAPGSEDHRS